mgnify:CR=1 FL=1
MLVRVDKVLIHFSTDNISMYSLRNGALKLLGQDHVAFMGGSVGSLLIKNLDVFLDKAERCVGEVNNECVRLYATGVFQQLDQVEQIRLVIQVYVNCGLYFNIVQPELERFYLEKSVDVLGTMNMLEGMLCQEFRKVVVCGSFQQHLKEIGDVMTMLQRRGITVLSPWTTKVVPETLGTDFILLEGQELINKRDAWRHKYEHMDKFRRSDAIIICNPGGIVGQGTMFEFGFMVAASKRIIFLEKPTNLSIPFPYEIGLNFQ